jgi:hypothetical protein
LRREAIENRKALLAKLLKRQQMSIVLNEVYEDVGAIVFRKKRCAPKSGAGRAELILCDHMNFGRTNHAGLLHCASNLWTAQSFACFRSVRGFAPDDEFFGIISIAIDSHIPKASFIAEGFVFVENRSPLGIVANRNLSGERWHFYLLYECGRVQYRDKRTFAPLAVSG